MTPQRPALLVGPLLPLLLLGLASLRAADDPSAPADSEWPDLATLGRIEVTSVSRRPVALDNVSAAVSVLTTEDIVRSGAKTIAEALRLVPGLMVAQVDANSWAIASRGFNSEYSGKLLVMVDGRSVYSPVLSLTFWDVQNAILEDIDRIEVIRGPGSTHWGANAVNGVINIATKNARDTQGCLAYAGGGWPQETTTGGRYGGRIDTDTYYRVYGLYQQSDAYPLRATGESGADRWHVGQGGFRVDHGTGDTAQWTWQGDAYVAKIPDESESSRGANTLGRLKRVLSDTSAVELQVYYDYTRQRNYLYGTTHQAADLDFQHNLSLGKRHALLWGLGCRLGHSRYEPTIPEFLSPKDTVTTRLYSGFVEDEILLVPRHLTLTPGCKIEHNDMTGWEPQPGLRLASTIADNRHAWLAVSRAVRTPSETEYFPATVYPSRTATGRGLYWPDSTIRSEKLIAYEAGYRHRLSNRLSAEIAVYLDDYDRIVAVVPTGETLPDGTARIAPANLVRGQVYGGELSLECRLADFWRLTAWYAFCDASLDAPPEGLGEVRRIADRIPTHQAHLRSSFDFAHRWRFDAQVRFIDRVDPVPSYIEADLRLACELGRGLELAAVAQNLLHDEHPEFRKAAVFTDASIPRGFYLKLAWRH